MLPWRRTSDLSQVSPRPEWTTRRSDATFARACDQVARIVPSSGFSVSRSNQLARMSTRILNNPWLRPWVLAALCAVPLGAQATPVDTDPPRFASPDQIRFANLAEGMETCALVLEERTIYSDQG